jgi:type II secretory ATPase GspE/PulE/Tfp pilus assembly ATPase PilB-like protein
LEDSQGPELTKNKNYQKGRAAEYRGMKKLQEEEGCERREIMRTAGSHGIFDFFSINPKTRRIVLVQAKSGESADEEIGKILPLIESYSGTYKVLACVR